MNQTTQRFIENYSNEFMNNWTKESVKVIDEKEYTVYKDQQNSLITLIVHNEINESNINWSNK